MQCRPPTAHGPPSRPPAALQTTTDASEENNTGPLGGPVISCTQVIITLTSNNNSVVTYVIYERSVHPRLLNRIESKFIFLNRTALAEGKLTLRKADEPFSSFDSWQCKALSTSATMLKHRSTLSKQHSTLLPKMATMSNEFIVKLRPFDKVETNWTCSVCFDFVDRTKFRSTLLPKNGNDIEVRFDFVEKIVRFVAFDNVAST